MASRTKQTQSIHDAVVRESAATYRSARAVYINPNGEKNSQVKGEYPGVVVVTNAGEIIIEEIEADESVTQSECDNQ